jgi:hypothetical protein
MRALVSDPAIDTWGTIFRRNIDRQAATGCSTRSALRSGVRQLANDYREELIELAASRGIALPRASHDAPFNILDSSPIVMTGHQPVIYHQGLVAKLDAARTFLQQARASYFHVVIDTDFGDCGTILYPTRVGERLELRRGSLTESECVYEQQRLAAAEQVAGVTAAIRESLVGCGLEEAAHSMTDVSTGYTALAGAPAAAANSIMRWRTTGFLPYEIPYSRFLRLPCVRDLLNELILQPRTFARAYNTLLADYRRDHRIDNPANPFPDMAITSDQVELPFWVVNAPLGTRRPAISEGDGKIALNQDEYLAPRGSLTTLILRAFCSDLFIHGSGGARYDTFVNTLGLPFLGFSLPDFVAASATEYLFEASAKAVIEADELKSKYKEIVSRPERYLGRGIFSDIERTLLTDLIDRRADLLQKLPTTRDSSAKSELLHALNGVNRELKGVLDRGSFQQRLTILEQPASTLSTWSCREFPFFFFAVPVATTSECHPR